MYESMGLVIVVFGCTGTSILSPRWISRDGTREPFLPLPVHVTFPTTEWNIPSLYFFFCSFQPSPCTLPSLPCYRNYFFCFLPKKTSFASVTRVQTHPFLHSSETSLPNLPFFSLFFFVFLQQVSRGVEALKNSPVLPFFPSFWAPFQNMPTPHFLNPYNSLLFFVFHVSTSTFSLFFCSLAFVRCSFLQFPYYFHLVNKWKVGFLPFVRFRQWPGWFIGWGKRKGAEY